MSDEKACAKCGAGPRAPGQRWCKPCRAADKRARRTGNTRGEHGEQSAGNSAPEAPARSALAVARAEVEALRLEVAMLKRQLAQAHALPVVTREPLDAVGVSTAAGVGKVCMHGSRNCQSIQCRVGRA